MSTQDLTLIGAWHTWWTVGSLSTMSIHGVPVTWIGRFGKLLQYIGALTVVLDIIGAVKLSHIAVSLKSINFGGIARRDALDAVRFAGHSLLGFLHSGKESPHHQAAARNSRYFWTDIAIALVLGSALAVVFAQGFIDGIVLFLLFTLFSYALLSPIVTAVFIALLALSGYVASVLFVSPIAALLSRPAADRYAKAVGLAVGTVGFVLDLIAS
jgi:hypothetical protein